MTKIKSAILSILLVLAFVPAVAQNYESMWKKVYNLQKKDRTASVDKCINDIYNIAKKKGNELQMFKAIVEKNNGYINPDSAYANIAQMKSLVDNTRNDTLRLFALTCYFDMCDDFADETVYRAPNEVIDFSWQYDKWTNYMFFIERNKVLDEILDNVGKYAGVSNKNYKDLIYVQKEDLPFNHDILSTICLSFAERCESRVYKFMLDEYGKNNKFVDAEIWSLLKYAATKGSAENISILENAMLNEKYKRAKLYPEIYLELISNLMNDNPKRALALCDEAIGRFGSYSR